jgi:hypothetical protein
MPTWHYQDECECLVSITFCSQECCTLSMQEPWSTQRASSQEPNSCTAEVTVVAFCTDCCYTSQPPWLTNARSVVRCCIHCCLFSSCIIDVVRWHTPRKRLPPSCCMASILMHRSVLTRAQDISMLAAAHLCIYQRCRTSLQLLLNDVPFLRMPWSPSLTRTQAVLYAIHA